MDSQVEDDVLLALEEDDDDISPWDIDWGDELPKYTASDDQPATEYETPRIDGDDYSDDQAAVLNILKRAVRAAVNVNTQWEKRKKAMDWCFVRGEVDKNGVDFHTACVALGARPEVIQARIQHQLYVSGIPLKEPLHLMADLLPDQYESEAIMAAWEDGLAVVDQVWRWPGIPIPELYERLNIGNPVSTLDKLEKAGLIAWRYGCVFLTGRSENRIKKRAFSWSRSFL